MERIVTTGPDAARTHLILAHGAGAPMTSPFLTAMAAALEVRDIRTSRFEFSYMAQRRTDGRKRPPPKMDVLAAEFRALLDGIAPVAGTRLFIGGKSMGGRVASLIADQLFHDHAISGLICLGYPFHPPRAPDRLRVTHLEKIGCPTLIVQGDRDALGCHAEVEGYGLSRAITFEWLTDGDHDFKPRVSSGFTQAQHIAAAADAVARFVSPAESAAATVSS